MAQMQTAGFSFPRDKILVTSDAVNCLIHSYLLDSGLNHTAFSFRKETNLEISPHFHKHIPRGELVELMFKSLLYTEVESHLHDNADEQNCQAPFSLLERHLCTTEPKNKQTPAPASLPRPAETSKANGTTSNEIASQASSSAVASTQSQDPNAMEVDASDSRKSKASEERGATALSAPPPPAKATNAKTRATLALMGHTSEVFVCAWNPKDQDILASGTKDSIIKLWKIPNPLDAGEYPVITIDQFYKADHGDLTSLHWNSEGTLLAIGAYDAVVRIVTATGALHSQHKTHIAPVFTTRFSRSGKYLLSASLDNTLCLWDVEKKRAFTDYTAHADCVLDVVWINESMFASCSADCTIHINHTNTPHPPIAIFEGHVKEINQVRVNADSTKLASCSDDTTARVWDISQVREPARPVVASLRVSTSVVLRGHTDCVTGVAWCPTKYGGHDIVGTASFDNTARLWDAETGQCLKVFEDHKRPVYALCMSPGGRFFATGSGDGWMNVYDIKTHEQIWGWFAGLDKPGVFEIDWQMVRDGNFGRIAVALECRKVQVLDSRYIPPIQES